MKGRRFAWLLVVALCVMIVYSPSFFGCVCNLDDASLMARLHKITHFDFVNLIRGGTGLYYRPLIAASYKLDAFLFNANVFAMHAENIFLHITNVLLLIAVLRKIFVAESDRYLPYFCGLLWGIHPLTTESVAWISGRSDVLASTFILAATLFLLNYRKSSKLFYLFLSLVLFFFGVLTKEVMLPFLVVIVLLLRVRSTENSKEKGWSLLDGKGLMLWLLPLAATGVFFLRLIAFNKTSSHIVMTLRFIFNDIYYSMYVCLRAFGFYFKKIIYPPPLNFAIFDVDPLYELLAIPLVLLCLYLLFKRDNLSALFLGGFALLTPAFLIAFNQIAWTPYAERYLYLPSAFMLPGIIGYIHHHLEFPSQRFKTIVASILLISMASGTFYRTIIWQTNETLFADTAIKSPLSRESQILYAGILIENGKYDQAMVAINKARAVSSLGYYAKPDNLEARILVKQGKLADALLILRNGAEKSKYKSKKNLKALVKLLEKVSAASIETKRHALYVEMRELHFTLFKLNHNYTELYSMADMSVKLGDDAKAQLLYKQVLRNVVSTSSLAHKTTKRLSELDHNQ